MKIRYSKKYIHTCPSTIVQVTFSRDAKYAFFKEGRDDCRILTLPIQDADDRRIRDIVHIFRSIIRTAKTYSVSRLGISFEDIQNICEKSELSEKDIGSLFATALVMADFSFDEQKTSPDSKEMHIKDVTVFGDPTPAFKEGVVRGSSVGEEINKTRILCNTPGSDLTPSRLAKEARKAAQGTGIKTTVLSKKRIESLKMGGVLGVAQGSSEEPHLIVMEYKGGKKKDAPVALIGKGLTFDTGGLNVKPGSSMLGMHMDMSGGAAVIHTIVAAAQCALPVNIVAVVPAVDNLVAGDSFKPGDFLTMMSGKTVEITHTDAEGRLVLADAITYAKRFFEPSVIIDVATLTGASIVALGDTYSATFSSDADLERALIAAGESSGERTWPLPVGPEYAKKMQGTFTDLVNADLSGASAASVAGGGASTAAAFLKEFVDADDRWAHIDIAPRMKAGESEVLAPGSVGSPVALLVAYLETLNTEQ